MLGSCLMTIPGIHHEVNIKPSLPIEKTHFQTQSKSLVSQSQVQSRRVKQFFPSLTSLFYINQHFWSHFVVLQKPVKITIFTQALTDECGEPDLSAPNNNEHMKENDQQNNQPTTT